MTSFRFWCRKPAGSHSLARPRLSIRNLINRHTSQLTLLQIGTEVIAMSGYQCTALYVDWIRRFILFHRKRHPAEMGTVESEAFLTHLAIERHVSASTQNQALSVLLFLY